MKILIPVNTDDRYLCLISSIEENSSWALVSLNKGKISKVQFYNRKEDIPYDIDFLVVINELEFVWPLLEDGIEVYIARKEKSIDEIIVAFLLNKLVPFSS